MAQVTKSLAVKKVSTVSTAPRKIKFTMATPIPNPPNLALLTLIENTGISTINGVIDSVGGTCDAQTPSSIFGPIWTLVTDPAHTHFTVAITYDDGTLSLSNVQVTSP